MNSPDINVFFSKRVQGVVILICLYTWITTEGKLDESVLSIQVQDETLSDFLMVFWDHA